MLDIYIKQHITPTAPFFRHLPTLKHPRTANLSPSPAAETTVRTRYRLRCRSAAVRRGPAGGEGGHACMFDQSRECKAVAKSL